MTTAIIGTGKIGSTLARLLVDGGEDVVLAGRGLVNARAVAGPLGVRALTVDEAITVADVVVLAVSFADAKQVLAERREALRGKVVVDPSNAVSFDSDGAITRLTGEDESAGQVLAALAPGARFVKAFGTQYFESLADGTRTQPPAALFYAADDEDAGTVVAGLTRAAGYVPVRVGGIDQSGRIEVLGDLHGLTLGRHVTEDEAEKLVRAVSSPDTSTHANERPEMTDDTSPQRVRLGERVTYDVPVPRVARATLTRSENGNLQDVHLFYQLDAAYKRAAADDSISVLVLAAEGDDFSLGHDVEALFSTDGMEQVTLEGGFSRGGVEGDMAWETEVFLELHWRWRNFPKPVVAAVQGRVFAGGMMTMWPADLIVASEEASFADPVTAFGIGHVELFLHPWELGARRAKELLFTGETMTAAEAKDVGMVSRVVPREDLEAATLTLAERIAARPTHGLRMAKKSVNQTLDLQGQWNAVQAAFSAHTLGHAHSRIAHEGSYIDPSGFALTRDIWDLPDTDV